jgi:hypothetical protein
MGFIVLHERKISGHQEYEAYTDDTLREIPKQHQDNQYQNGTVTLSVSSAIMWIFFLYYQTFSKVKPLNLNKLTFLVP